MSYTIAVAGKGGVGKSTIASILVQTIAEKIDDIILAVDADPNANLGEKLGVPVEKTIGDLREDLLNEAEDIPAGTSKQEYVRYQLRLAMAEGEMFDLLTMGRPEGPGCYCYINNILRTYLDNMMEEYPYVIIDNEAGMEHLSRRTTKEMGLLVVVTDATKVGVETAMRIAELSEEMELKVARQVLLVNRAPEDLHPVVKDIISESGFENAIQVPFDKQVEELTIAGEPLTVLDRTSAARRTIKSLVQDIREWN